MSVTYRDAAGATAELESDDIGAGVQRPGHSVKAIVGAANLAISQVTATTTSGTLAIARSTRRNLYIRNTDATLTVYVGTGTVTSGSGFPLKAGESMPITSVAAVNVLAASGTPIVAIVDEY